MLDQGNNYQINQVSLNNYIKQNYSDKKFKEIKIKDKREIKEESYNFDLEYYENRDENLFPGAAGTKKAKFSYFHTFLNQCIRDVILCMCIIKGFEVVQK